MGGLWPLLHLRSFEWVLGPKTDVWLQMTTGGLLVSAGVAQLAAPPGPQGPAQVHRIGLGTALTLLAVDLVYVPKGRIRPAYLLDAAMQPGWITAWLRSAPSEPRSARVSSRDPGTRCRQHIHLLSGNRTRDAVRKAMGTGS
ncbi:hypothetical protein [Streptomyces azureus]|uniref:Uncharacterized protein n=1 Tax=Streptomyces azureus TaxID=146537 RepID=A0A0K8PES5_STRAJ|nr:hypothetical protein [Streptomyces azureus]GAP46273.1 uncharacterized protein SAZU_1011 [Streptomyces azureus]